MFDIYFANRITPTSLNKGRSVTVSTLYLEHFQLNHTPFDQEPVPGIFFPAAGRKTVLKNILADIEYGKQLVQLSGSEGTGKTLLCRLLEELIDQDKFLLISLEHPIGSFQDLLRTLCLSLGTVEEADDEEDDTPADYVQLFRDHLQRIESKGRNLVLLIDEAENLFLATLERLIRLICDSEQSRNLQVVLVGRPELGANLEQLSIYCSNVDVTAGYTLDALTPEETRKYIQFRLRKAGPPGDKYLEIFSDDAIDMIFQAAMGNISLTNSLAEMGLKKACSQGMFQVDDELIQPQQNLEDNMSLALGQGYDFIRDNKWWLLAGTLLVWVVLMLLWPASKEKQVEVIADKNEKLGFSAPQEQIVVPPEPEIVEHSSAVDASGEDQPEVPEKTTLPGKQQTPDTPMSELTYERPPDKKVEKKEIVLKPDRRKKIVLAAPAKVEEPVSPPEPKTEKPARDGNALFEERIKASSGWVAWAYRGWYTVQLMVLASENAEENLKKILVDDKYYAIKDKLYILRKISPQTIFVFYGNFSTMAEARKARNMMPPFLRDIKPYALSIEDALKKVEE